LAVVLIGSLLTPAHAFTTGQSASLVIGHKSFNWDGSVTNPANATGFDDPGGVSFDASGNLWVADLWNNRVLMFRPPFAIGMAASLVIGQTDFKGYYFGTTEAQFNEPSCLVFDASGNLWVADYGNNRVLTFKPPFTTGMAANVVIGQSIFTDNTGRTTQSGLNGPLALAFDSVGNLWVSDTNNNRVLMFKPPFTTGMAATLVIGHKSFTWGGAVPANATGFNYPAGLSFDTSGNLWVADESNNRVLMFKPPFATGMAASLVIGQTDFSGSTSGTSQTTLFEPSGLAFDPSGGFWISDGINHRVLMFRPPFTTGMAASLVIGQTDFNSNSPGTSQTALRYPNGIGFDAVGNLWVADSANNRVLMFPTSTGLSGFLLELQAGWNLISLPLMPTKTATAKLLTPLIQLHELVVVWGFMAPNTWSYFKPPNLGTLTTMVDGKGYWVLVTDAINITIVGYVITPGSTPPTYSLAVGWNLVGYKPQPDPTAIEEVSTYLAGISSSYDPNNVWLFSGGNWVRLQPTDTLAPGQAMWIRMTAPATVRP